jgi:hypothetical protein
MPTCSQEWIRWSTGRMRDFYVGGGKFACFSWGIYPLSSISHVSTVTLLTQPDSKFNFSESLQVNGLDSILRRLELEAEENGKLSFQFWGSNSRLRVLVQVGIAGTISSFYLLFISLAIACDNDYVCCIQSHIVSKSFSHSFFFFYKHLE